MSGVWARFPGFILGAGLGGLLPCLALALMSSQNPRFIDDLPSLLLVGVLPIQILAALLLAWRGPRSNLALGVGLAAGVGAALLLGRGVAAERAPIRWRPALVVVALPGVPWEAVEATPMPTALGLATRGASGWFQPEMGGLDGWITLDSGIDTRGRPWLGERPKADQVEVARWWQVADWAGARPGLIGWPVSAPPTPLQSGVFVWPLGLGGGFWPDDLHGGQTLLDTTMRPSAGLVAGAGAVWGALPRGLRWSTVRDGAAYRIGRALHPEDSTWTADRPLLRARMERDLWSQLIEEQRPDVLLLSLSGPAATAGGPSSAAALNQADQHLAELLGRLDPEATIVLLSEQGWIVIAGPDALPGTRLGEISPLDVAPTLLGLLDLGAAHDMRGRALLGGPPAEINTWDGLARARPPDADRARAADEALRAAQIEGRSAPPPDDGW